ncbi:phage holin [Listeria ilorinensis]|uniref:phage holin n=1 Tax=Listeria ilorinensis TaxID=2867439 RepID=UPI001EF45AB5|nr:phage holin [Listeria ilorinensis]
MKINWKVRLKNWRSWLLAIVTLVAVIWSAGGFTTADLDSWNQLGQAFMTFLSKPSAIITVLVALFANYVDPTTSGFSDSQQALNYKEPRKDEEK